MKGYAWNPWHGCKRLSEGCANCYMYRTDLKYDRDPSVVTRSKTNFDLPIKKDRKGTYKLLPYAEVATCLSSDFFIEEADPWRAEAWDIIKKRSDLNFFIPTKRIARVNECLPSDWNDGYENVLVAVSVENQKRAEERLPHLLNLPLKRRWILTAPLLEKINLDKYLQSGKIDLVSVSGESCFNARECRFEWVEDLRRQCKENGVVFEYHQTGSNFVKDGVRYKIPREREYEQAKCAFSDDT